MKRALLPMLAVAVVMLLCAPLYAVPAPAKSPPSVVKDAPYVPLYPGATIITELNFSDEDVLAVVEQLIGGLASLAGKADPEKATEVDRILSELNFASLNEAISGLKRVRVVQANLPPAKRNARKIIEYYDGALSKGPWRRIVLSTPTVDTGTAIYVLPPCEGYLAVVLRKKPGAGDLIATRTVGSIDIVKAVEWGINAGRVIERVKKEQQSKATDQQSGSPEQQPAQPEPKE